VRKGELRGTYSGEESAATAAEGLDVEGLRIASSGEIEVAGMGCVGDATVGAERGRGAAVAGVS
jgi:hypothetical protein